MKKFLTVLLMLAFSVNVYASNKVTKAASTGLPVAKLSKDNTAVLFGVVDGTSVSDVIQQIQKLDSSMKSGYPIYLVLYTPGGSIQDGLELIEFLNSVNRPVNTVTIFAASMGFQIAQNAGNRYIIQNGVLMSHKAAGGFEGEFGDGMSQIDSRYGLWMSRILELDQQTVKRTNGKQTLKSYRAAYQNELWRTGSQSVKEGYADKVVQASCSKDLNDTTRVQNLEFFGMPIKVTYSGCPLNTNPLSVEVELPTNKGTMSHKEFLAKGGVFLKDNKEVGGYYTPDLYCTDSSLTLADLKSKLVDVKKEVVARQRRVIKGY
jgi:ATP-dependent protease ClpP protease subunit